MNEQHEQILNGHVANDAATYCRRCSYQLRGLTTPRCPECGQEFDPANPRTFRRRPIRRWVRQVMRAAIALVAIALLLTAVWSWLYWGWHSEQQALAALKVEPTPWDCKPIVSPWLREHLGPLGFVLDRVTGINPSDTSDLTPLTRLAYLDNLDLSYGHITDLTPLSGLTKLKGLSLDSTHVKDLSPLATMTNLRRLDLRSAKMVTDISALSNLTKLEVLDCHGTGITDLLPLAGLAKLQHLDVSDTGVMDLSPLTKLTKLEWLRISGTPINDLAPLAGIKSLHTLWLPRNDTNCDELRRASPDLLIEGY